MVGNFNANGKSTNRFVIDSAFYGTQIKLLAEIVGVSGHNRTGDEINLLIDSAPTTLIQAPGNLVSIDSDGLENVPVELTLHDDAGFSLSSVAINWKFVNNGRIIDGSEGTDTIPVKFQSDSSSLYSGNVDMNLSLIHI